jgi:iron complex outermembrane recepter protein
MSRSRPLRRSPLAVAVAALLLAPGLWAEALAQSDPRHDDPVELDRVVVRASPLPATAEDLARPVEVLSGARLDEAKSNSLGETVERLPGVQSSYFGPGVGRPIVRGLDGARVQVLSDGLASGDVSTVSVDHAVSIEPFLANQIEILKGPATLLYGSGAIGGAVNVVDGRVPEEPTSEPFEGRAELRGGTVNDERTGMVRLDGTSADGNLVFHFDALHRETGDYRIPGFAELHGEEEHEDHEEDPEEHEDEVFGRLPNSFVRTDAAALGLSYIGDRGFIGGAWSLFNTRYGVPGHGHQDEEHDEHEEEDEHDEHDEHGDEDVRIVMDQRRGEIRGGLDDLGPFESARIKLARTWYTHTEFEGDEVGTVFDNDSTEGRLELRHRPWGGWNGAFGMQVARRDFNAIGEEAFVPASRGSDAGVFWIGERQFGAVKLELGARHDRVDVEVDPSEAIGPSRDFSATSVSGAVKYDVSEALHLTFNLDRAQRAPVAEELYSAGEHVATRSFEFGDPGLGVETANRAELGVHWHAGPLELRGSIYHVNFDDFIYLADTGVEEHGLPVRVWNQEDARFTGAEVEARLTLADNDTGRWQLRGFGDVVRGRLAGSGTREVEIEFDHGDHEDHVDAEIALSGNLPRIVAPRVGADLRWDRGDWRASLGAVHYLEQDRVAEFETPTPGYTLVNANVTWHIDTRGGNAWEVFLDGTNLLDEEARPHTSFLKDLAPRPGRGVAFGVRAFF